MTYSTSTQDEHNTYVFVLNLLPWVTFIINLRTLVVTTSIVTTYYKLNWITLHLYNMRKAENILTINFTILFKKSVADV